MPPKNLSRSDQLKEHVTGSLLNLESRCCAACASHVLEDCILSAEMPCLSMDGPVAAEEPLGARAAAQAQVAAAAGERIF